MLPTRSRMLWCLTLLLAAAVIMAASACRKPETGVGVGQEAPSGFLFPIDDAASVEFPRELRGTPLMISFFSPG